MSDNECVSITRENIATSDRLTVEQISKNTDEYKKLHEKIVTDHWLSRFIYKHALD